MGNGDPRYAASNCSSTSGEGQVVDSNQNKSPPQTKRRASRAGTRSVSTLTTAQLQRKRANDREAQRAIRQRNKEHIDSLERRIEELSNTNVDAAALVQANQRVRELEDELSKVNDSLANSRTHQTPAHSVWQARNSGDLVHSQYNNGLIVPRTTTYGSATISGYHDHSPTYGSQMLIAGNTEDHKGFVLGEDTDLPRTWAPSSIALGNASPMNFASQSQYISQTPSFYSPTYGSGAVGTSTYIGQPATHAFEMPVRYGPAAALSPMIF